MDRFLTGVARAVKKVFALGALLVWWKARAGREDLMVVFETVESVGMSLNGVRMVKAIVGRCLDAGVAALTKEKRVVMEATSEVELKYFGA